MRQILRTGKRFWAAVLALTMLFGLAQGALAAEPGLRNFTKTAVYQPGQFGDVAAGAWYASSVASAYELGLVNGKGSGIFHPSGNVTIAETLALACRLHKIYHTGSGEFTQGSPWYRVYADYAVAAGIIGAAEYTDYNAYATRAQFAAILGRALPTDALTEINRIDDGAIPDVTVGSSFGGEVYRLYRAGVLTGNDAAGTFAPGSSIQRSAVAAIVTRMADPSQRQKLTLTAGGLTAEQIYAKCSPAVFYIELYDESGTATSSGSGFFLDAAGTAVTNYHVIEGAHSARILRSDNDQVYTVAGVYDYDEENDWAVIKIDGSGFPYLTPGDPSAVAGGAPVFAIGSPEGLDNTISEGLISNPNRVLGGVSYIQTSAPISHGSSGGALLNKQGQVIGITSAGIDSGENLGFALPISVIQGYDDTELTPLSELAQNTSYSDQTVALICLWNFLDQNANDTIADCPMYSEEYPNDHGYQLYGVFYDEEEDEIVLYYQEDYEGEMYFSYLYLSDEMQSYLTTYYFYLEGSDEPNFWGWSALDATTFDGDNFEFTEWEADPQLSVELNTEFAGDNCVGMLIFLESILDLYDYTDDVFGFVNI